MPHRHKKLSERSVGGIALSICILSDATFNAFSKELSTALSPLSLLFFSELLTLLFILISFGLIPISSIVKKFTLRTFLILFVVGFLTGVAGPFLWFSGIRFTTAVNAGFFSKMDLVVIVTLAYLLLNEKITRAHLSAMAAIIAGIVIISLKGFTDGLTMQYGDFLIVCGIFCYSIGHIVFRKYLHHIEQPFPLLARSIIAMLVFCIALPFVQHPFMSEIKSMPISLVPVLIGFAFISRFLNSTSFYVAIERLKISTISLISSLTIVTSTLFAWLYLGEAVHWYHIAGGAFIILGTLLLEILRDSSKPLNRHAELRTKQRPGH